MHRSSQSSCEQYAFIQASVVSPRENLFLFADVVPDESDSGHSALWEIHRPGDPIILIALSVDIGSLAAHCQASVNKMSMDLIRFWLWWGCCFHLHPFYPAHFYISSGIFQKIDAPQLACWLKKKPSLIYIRRAQAELSYRGVMNPEVFSSHIISFLIIQ